MEMIELLNSPEQIFGTLLIVIVSLAWYIFKKRFK